MISKSEIDQILSIDLLKVLTTDTFYHYTKFNIAIDFILKNHSIQFSDPTTFNDPFDCSEKLLKLNYTDSIVNEAINNSPISLSRQQRRELKRSLNNPKYYQDILKTERKKYKIACFSEYFNETLMWSHYADKHSGICIGFNFPHKYEDKFVLCPVKYLNELKPIDGTTDFLRIIMYWLTTKQIQWDYEHEIRAITKSNVNSKNELIEFDPKYIREIIFGYNVTDSEFNAGIMKIRKSGLDLDTVLIKRIRINEQNSLLKDEIIKLST